jgi:hypothetical protein
LQMILAAAWHPRGELPRLIRLYPQVREVYTALVVSLPPGTDGEVTSALSALPGVHVHCTRDWSTGRHTALFGALELPGEAVHLADLDRLLRWVETLPQEWRKAVRQRPNIDCLIIGRTASAYQTHPRSLARSEAISNLVTSSLLGHPVDASAGYRCFSRKAVEYLKLHSRPGDALGMDAAWPVMLQRAGYRVESIEVDGLDWEIADQFQEQAASPERQAQVADAYDQDPRNWARRVEVALEIVRCGLEAAQQAERDDRQDCTNRSASAVE